jgi:diguanylate cyclase (GGDEF)-like protein/PAS domain S-box-containing protein
MTLLATSSTAGDVATLGAAPDAAFVLDPDLLMSFPGAAGIVSDGRMIRANPAGAALWRALPEPLPRAPANCRVVIGARQYALTLLPMEGGETLLLAHDATLERNLVEALTRSRQMFRDIVLCSSDFAWESTADGRFGFVTPRGALGFSAQELANRPTRDLAVDLSGVWPFEDNRTHDETEVRLRGRDGSVRSFNVSSVPVVDAQGRFAGARGVARDITEDRERDRLLLEAHRRAKHLARVDDLTGLLNRRAFVQELETRLAHARRHGNGGVLMYLDLDNFKSINDVRGHAEGDDCLRRFSADLQAQCRAEDLVGRLGGDEFTVWLEHAGLDGARRKAEDLIAMARDLAATYSPPDKPLGLSIGLAPSRTGDDVAALMHRADEAMYSAKRGGKSRLSVAEEK